MSRRPNRSMPAADVIPVLLHTGTCAPSADDVDPAAWGGVLVHE